MSLCFWVVSLLLVNIMKALNFPSWRYRILWDFQYRFSNVIEFFYWCSILKQASSLHLSSLNYFRVVSIYNSFISPFYEHLNPPEKYNLESARLIFSLLLGYTLPYLIKLYRILMKEKMPNREWFANCKNT